ncbi:erythromycin esterase family protein [Geothrix campi]|uniref:erythromycin esterase family protein n=1 Tax=Geothrix campi TaxID=2966450 RepID=UPI0021478F1E|nr:erythromycin esterase family protein [Geothrix sp. SG10]
MMRMALFLALSVPLMAASVPVRVEGRVLGPGGEPVSGAVVALVPTGGRSGLSPTPEQRTDAKGQFWLEASAGRFGLTVTARTFSPHFRNLDLKAEGSLQPLEVRLEKGGHRVQGTLLPAQGLGLTGVRIGFSKISQDDGDEFYGEVKLGRFDITLAPGDYLINVEAKGQTGRKRVVVRGDIQNETMQLSAEPQPAGPETLAWIKQKAIPLQGVEAGRGFSDMQPMRALVGDATVVGLGEATHGTREFFQLKHRMLEFLATEMGFTVFAIEANLPEAFAVDDYVVTGKGDPAKALAGLYFWTWNTEEVLDMIRWMRRYNEDPAHLKKLRFYGVDMQTETVAYAEAKAWLDIVDPAEAGHLAAIRTAMVKLPAWNNAKRTDDAQAAWRSIAQGLEALIVRLDGKSLSEGDVNRQRQNIRVLAQFAAMQAEVGRGNHVRDESMAANLRWIQAREQGAKVVLWAHNGHISFHPGSIGGDNSLGWHLRQRLGKAYLPIGFAFSEGGFQAISGDSSHQGLRVFEVKPLEVGTLDAALAATGHPVLALDLRSRPSSGPVKRWLASPQGSWSIGAMFRERQAASYLVKQPIVDAYDAILFVKRTTSARPVGGRGIPMMATAKAKEPVNLGFEDGLNGWSNPRDRGFKAAVTGQGAKQGAHCLQVAFEGDRNPAAWWTGMQVVDATAYRGKKVRLSGWIRTDGKPDCRAMFWMRVDCSSGMGFFDNMMRRPVTGAEWTEVAIEGPVAVDAVNLNFGCMIQGMGSAWFDGVRLEVLP